MLAEHGRIKDPQTAAVDRSGPSRDELTQQVSEHQAAREQAEHRLREAVATIQRVREGRFADAIAAAKELANRESAFAAKVQAAETTVGSLEQRLADREAALRDTEARAASEGAASENAARRQIELETHLAEAAEIRRTLEAKLDRANASLHAARQGLDDAAAGAAQVARQRDAADEHLNAVRTGFGSGARADRAADAIGCTSPRRSRSCARGRDSHGRGGAR